MRLSEFRDEQGVEVVAKLLVPIGKIVSNEKNAKAQKEANEGKGSMLDFVSALLQNSPRDVMDMLAILDGKDPNEYHCSAATVLVDALHMMSDHELLMLFGLQRQTLASPGSALETTGAQETPVSSSDTPAPVSKKRRKKKRTKHT